MHREKVENKDILKKDSQEENDPILNHIRTEVQKIIDKYLKEDERFSVMDFGYDGLNLLIDLLTKKKTRKDIENEHKQNEKEIEKTYEQIVNEYNFMKSLKNLAKGTKSDLTSLNSDISLESDLEEIDSK